MRELAEAAEVSPSQLRYWERKGYIHSEQTQENSSHKYQLAT
ncbi:MAG: MerR family DNA-binding transcriptional regulator, partial [Limosilactobacillus fermentum]|nr:MerR family DNA-binding transcriptional regulator [Limosilactobacillus fermentum]